MSENSNGADAAIIGTGTAVGAAIGSVVPVVGTVIGGAVGGGVGAVIAFFKKDSSSKK